MKEFSKIIGEQFNDKPNSGMTNNDSNANPAILIEDRP